MLTWTPTVFIRHIMSRSHDHRFSIPLWETWFCSSLGVPIPVLIGNPHRDDVLVVNLVSVLTVITFRRVSVNLHHYHLTNGSCISTVRCFVRLVTGHRDEGLCDLTTRKRQQVPSSQWQTLTLMMDVTMTLDRYGRTTQRTNGTLTHRVSSTGAPQ